MQSVMTLTQKQKESIYLLNIASQYATLLINRLISSDIDEHMHNLTSNAEMTIIKDLTNGIPQWKPVYDIVMFIKRHLDDQECREEIALWDGSYPQSQLDKIENIWRLTPKIFWESVLYDIQSLDPKKYL